MNTHSSAKPSAIYSVSQLNRLAKMLLEDHFPAVLVEGEISNFSRPASGHWYLSLKDDKGQVRCAMFRNRNMMVRTTPREGMRVLVKGKLSLYEGRGDYQLILEQLEETGAGELRRAYELLLAKLQTEGLFAPEHKKALPVLPSHLAVITSATGAAIQDVLSVLKRRFPALQLTIIPVSVQGEQSAREITSALELVNKRQGCLSDVDVVLLTRGGGSLEDLWSFNDETLARTIHASALPVIAAVGHEVDFTIAEFVADVRAATPSAAAELLVPHQNEYRSRLSEQSMRLQSLIKQTISKYHQSVQHFSKRLQHPGRRLQEHAQRLDELETRLKRSINLELQKGRQKLNIVNATLNNRSPVRQLAGKRQSLQTMQSLLKKNMQVKLQQSHSALREQSRALHSVSPLATLARGYSITSDEQGKIITDYEQLSPGATIISRLANGKLTSVVASSDPDPQSSE